MKITQIEFNVKDNTVELWGYVLDDCGQVLSSYLKGAFMIPTNRTRKEAKEEILKLALDLGVW